MSTDRTVSLLLLAAFAALGTPLAYLLVAGWGA